MKDEKQCKKNIETGSSTMMFFDSVFDKSRIRKSRKNLEKILIEKIKKDKEHFKNIAGSVLSNN